LLRSDIAEQVEGLDVAQAAVGVFGRRVEDPGSHTLSDGDRVEIYRPLRVDPMESRRRRAKARRA
jgi:putative ubiquitin-RnfH superfamily antitoxin RatB of RatAB toxin-antitoxin module